MNPTVYEPASTIDGVSAINLTELVPDKEVNDAIQAREFLQNAPEARTLLERGEAAKIIQKIRPDMELPFIVDNFDSIMEGITGKKPTAGMHPGEVLVGSIQDYMAQSELYDLYYKEQFKPTEAGQKRLAELEQRAASIPMRGDNPWWWSVVTSPVQVLGSVVQAAPKVLERGAQGMAGGAVVGALATSPTGPGAMAGAALGGASGLGVGAQYGYFESTLDATMKATFYEQSKRGVNKDVAFWTSLGIGAGVASVDLMGLKGAAGAWFKKAVAEATSRTLTSPQIALIAAKHTAKNIAEGVAHETATEVTQEVIQALGENLAYGIQNARKEGVIIPYDKTEELLARFLETAKTTAIGMGVLGGIGSPMLGYRIHKQIGGVAAPFQDYLKKAEQVGADNNVMASLLKSQPAPDTAAPEGHRTGFIALDPRVTTGQGLSPGDLDGAGVRVYATAAEAEAASQDQRTGSLDAKQFLTILQKKYPIEVAQAAQQAIDGKRPAGNFDAVEKDFGINMTDILDLAQGIKDGTRIDGQDALVREYGLEKATTPGGILTVAMDPQNIVQAATEEEAQKAFQGGAKAVEVNGQVRIKDAAAVTPVARRNSIEDQKVLTPVVDMSVRKNGNRYEAVASDGTVYGSLHVDTSGPVTIRDINVPQEYRRQGVATALLEKAAQDHDGARIDWGRMNTAEGRGLRDSFRRRSAAYDRFAPTLDHTEARLEQVRSDLADLKAREDAADNADVIQGLEELVPILEAQKAFYEEKLDAVRGDMKPDPAEDTPTQYRERLQGKELTREAMQRVLEKQISTEEAEAVLAMVDRFAAHLGRTTDKFLQDTLGEFSLVNRIGYRKGLQQRYANGVTLLNNAQKKVIQIAAKGNVTTVIHEFLHIMRPLLSESDQAVLREAYGKPIENLEDFEEWFTRQGEAYFREGKAPDPLLKRIMDKLAVWFKWIYEGLTGQLPATVDPGVQVVMDRILTVAADAPVALNPDGTVAQNMEIYQPAYHGSPYRFEKFTTAAMGTGEGAQAYGWGLYFAGNKSVAEWYRSTLEKMVIYYDGVPLASASLDEETKARLTGLLFNTKQKTPEEAIANAIKNMTENMAKEEDPATRERIRAGIESYKSLDPSKVKMEARSQLYEVNIPDQEEYLDWDKPISEQNDKVLAAVGISHDNVKKYNELSNELDRLQKNGKLDTPEWNDLVEKTREMNRAGFYLTGERWYKELSKEHGGDRAASEYLKSLGIPGITYLDGNSRNAGEGHHNYVIFSDEDVTITKKYYQDDLEPGFSEKRSLYESVDKMLRMDPLALETREVPEGIAPRRGWIKENYPMPGAIQNNDTGRNIIFTSDAREKMARFSANIDRVSITPDLPEIVKDATLLKTEGNMKPNEKPHVVTVRHYGRIIERNGNKSLVLITTEEHERKETIDYVENWHLEKERAQNTALHEGAGRSPHEASLPHKNRIIQILREVNHPDFLYQDDTDYRQAVRDIRETEKLIRDFRDSIEEKVRTLGKGKGDDYRTELRKQMEDALAKMEAGLEADRAKLAAAIDEAAARAAQQGEDFNAHREWTRQAVEAGRPVPQESLNLYKDFDWAAKELARRELFRGLIDEAKEYKDLESWLAEVQAWEDFSGEPKSPEVQAEAGGDYNKAQELYKNIYLASRITTPAEADRQFKASLSEPGKVEEYLLALGRHAYLDQEKNIPRHVRAQALKIQKNTVDPKELARIRTTMENDPRTYRRLVWSSGTIDRDQALLEMLALEKDEEAFLNAQEPTEVKVDVPDVPSDIELELKAALILGNRDRAWLVNYTREQEKSIADLEEKLQQVEKDAAKGVKEALQAGREARNSAAEEVRLEIKRKMQSISAARKELTYRTKITKAIMRPVSKNCLVDYRIQIEAIQDLLDPKNRMAKTEARKAGLAAWYTSHPEAMKSLTRRARREIFGRSLNLWTTTELRDAYEEVQALRQSGREKLQEKKDAWDAEVENWKHRVLEIVLKKQLDAYKEMGTTTDQARREALQAKIIQWEKSRRNINQATSEHRQKGDLEANVLTISNLANILDGMDEDFKGPNHELLYRLPKLAENDKLKMVEHRYTTMFAWMKANDMTTEELGRKIAFDVHQVQKMKIGREKIYSALAKEYTIDELLTVYVGMKNELKAAALVYGNRVDPDVIAYVNNGADFAKYRTLGDKLIDEYEKHKLRLAEAFHDYQNEILAMQENYTPMVRQSVAYESMDEQLSWEKGQAMAVTKASVDRGMTKDRIKMNAAHQIPIRLGEFGLWLQQVGRQEQYIAMAPVVKRLNQVYGARDVNTAIQEVYGNGFAREVKEYINLLANPYGSKTWNWLESIAAKVRGNAAVAYMAYNPLTVLKQAPAIAQYLPYTGPGELLASVAEFARDPRGVWLATDEKSIQVKNRMVHQELQDLEAGKLDPAQAIRHKIARLGMQGIPAMDKIIVVIGWNAVYKTAKGKGLTDAAAVEYADRITNATQATTSVIDTSGLFRKPSEFTRALTMFAGPTNKILNEMVYAMPKAIRNGQHWKAAAIGGSYIVGAVALWILANGKPPEKPEDWIAAIAQQTVDMVPVIGSVISAEWRGWGDSTPTIQKPIKDAAGTVLDLVDAIKSSQDGDLERAGKKLETGIISALDTAGLALGVPTTEPKRIYKAIKNQNAWELIGWGNK